ncbi:MAG: nucleotidyl transferase AbiEii/AbiGii toxin family protein [bacterium]|nr:nucleotidyl transferase AbiEii/AbiGii toxin family protein [bacterium]
MLSRESLEKFTKLYQTDIENAAREYCQHLFLSFLYQQPEAEKLLFKGGTALRIILKSPRFSEDLDFTGSGILQETVEELFAKTLSEIERTGIKVDIIEAKKTTGGYLGIATFFLYELKIKVQIEVSLRNERRLKGIRTLIQSDYLPAYTLVHLPIEDIVKGKLTALFSRKKPRDFYDYYFLLAGNYSLVKESKNLKDVQEILQNSEINFRAELKKLLPVSHQMILRDFKKNLTQEIKKYLS